MTPTARRGQPTAGKSTSKPNCGGSTLSGVAEACVRHVSVCDCRGVFEGSGSTDVKTERDSVDGAWIWAVMIAEIMPRCLWLIREKQEELKNRDVRVGCFGDMGRYGDKLKG